MRIRQKGAAVNLSRMIGGAFLIVSAISLLGGLASVPLLITDGISDIEMLAAQTVVPLFITAGMVWIGSYYFTMYPDLELIEDGIMVKRVISKRSFPWNEIEDLAETKRFPKARVIILRRKGLFLNRLHGLFMAQLRDKPVILVSPRAENVQKFFQALETRLESSQALG